MWIWDFQSQVARGWLQAAKAGCQSMQLWMDLCNAGSRPNGPQLVLPFAIPNVAKLPWLDPSPWLQLWGPTATSLPGSWRSVTGRHNGLPSWPMGFAPQGTWMAWPALAANWPALMISPWSATLAPAAAWRNTSPLAWRANPWMFAAVWPNAWSWLGPQPSASNRNPAPAFTEALAASYRSAGGHAAAMVLPPELHKSATTGGWFGWPTAPPGSYLN